MARDEEAREVQRRHEAGDLDAVGYEEALRALGYGWTTDAQGRPMWRDPGGMTLTTSDGSLAVVPVWVTLHSGSGHETVAVDMPAEMFDLLRASEALLSVIVAMVLRACVVAFWSAVGGAAVLTSLVRPESGAWVACAMLLVLGVVTAVKARRRA